MDSPRPVKKIRRTGVPQDSDEATTDVVHLCISEGIVSRKHGGKKAPLSCCECRRLKLKCDRTFPCASCKKRGCAQICPEGTLVSGKGTRFILANTEQLHEKIMEMSDRIRQLEDALHILHSSHSSNPHPLMHPDLLNIKSTMGLYGGTQTGAGVTSAPTLENENDDIKPVYLDVDYMDADSLDQQMANPSEQIADDSYNSPPDSPGRPGQFTAEIMQLSHAFPMSEKLSTHPSPVLRGHIRSMLPSRSNAEYLWEQARQNALWQYNPHNNTAFMPDLLHHVYCSSLDDLCPRRLALLLMILAVGCHVDLNERTPGSSDAEKYHHLARAALCEIPVMEEANVETITVLFYEIWYLLVFSDDKKAAGYAWGLMGLTAKLAQSIDLHRNLVKSKVNPEEVEKRRYLFWELMYLDARLSLSLGRPPSLFLNHMDCKRPSYTPEEGCDPSESMHCYQEWKHSCYVHCLSPVLEVQNRPLEYNVVIDLDKRIREFSIPPPVQTNPARCRLLTMQKASLSTALEAVLLQLHRPFFTRALGGPEEAFNRSHQYAPSVVAVFLSASQMIAIVQELFRREPQLAARILWYWSNAFSAAVALYLLVSRMPSTCLSSAALQELEKARVLFNSAKDTCPRALQVIPILETLVGKANHIYSHCANRQEGPSTIQPHTDDASASDGFSASYGSAADYTHTFITSPPPSDSFVHVHQSLSQCIEEVHQRALSLSRTRKLCQCSATMPTSSPVRQSWTPSPKLPHSLPTASPVQSDLHSGIITFGVLHGDGPAIHSPPPPVSPTSTLAGMESSSIDIGALNSTNGSRWMAWF